MKTNATINRIKDGIYAQVSADIATYAEVRKAQVAKIVGAKVDDGLVGISELLAGLNNIVAAATVEDVGLPKFISKVRTSDSDVLKSVTLSISSKLRAEVKYKREFSIAVDDSLIVSLGNAYVEALFELFYLEMAHENVAVLNEEIAKICAENEVPANFKFDVEMSDAIVLSITDEMVVFNADLHAILNISSLGIFQSGDGYNDLVRNGAVSKLIEQLKLCQTTVQLIKGKVNLIKDITHMSTKKRASKLIRGAYHRQAKYLDRVKSGVGYYEEVVKIDGNDTKVFALVEKTEDGDMKVVLHPFDVNTMFNVEYDVLGALK